MGDLPAYVIAAAGVVVVSTLTLFWVLTGVRPKDSASPLASGASRGPANERTLHLQAPARERLLRPAWEAIARRARGMTPAGWVEGLEHRLALAGSPPAWSVERVLAVKLVLGIGVLVVTGLWAAHTSLAVGGTTATFGRFAMVIAASVGAYLLPDALINSRGKKRQQEIQARMPDMLDQMTISVEAGLGFEAAMQRAAAAGSGAQAEELRRTLNEISLGIPRRQAFLNLANRSNVPELRHFVFAVNQAEDYGLPIAQVLRVQARELRVLRRQRAEERAMKIPVKIVLPLVFCIFPSLFIVILFPAMVRIFETLQ